MTSLIEALRDALGLIFAFNPDVVQYSTRSLLIAVSATLVAGTIGVPAGFLVSTHQFPGKRPLVTALNTMLSFPTVVIGLFVYSFICRSGPLGRLDLLFSIPAIVLGEVILILPIITTLTIAAVTRVDRDVRRTAQGLGADRIGAHLAVLRESRFGVLASVTAAFGRVIGEVGVAMILGGNIDGFTRTMTTAIALQTDMGGFETALALGIILLAISLAVNILLQWLQGSGHE